MAFSLEYDSLEQWANLTGNDSLVSQYPDNVINTLNELYNDKVSPAASNDSPEEWLNDISEESVEYFLDNTDSDGVDIDDLDEDDIREQVEYNNYTFLGTDGVTVWFLS